jgi:hypothetical protein
MLRWVLMLKTREGAFIRRSRRSLCFLSPALKIKCKDLFMPRKLLVGKATLNKLKSRTADTVRYQDRRPTAFGFLGLPLVHTKRKLE